MKLLLIACEIVYREICYCISQSKNMVDTRFLKKGLHDIGCEKMSQTIQEEIASVPQDGYEAILLGYALCNNGIRDLYSENLPIVVPRAHDCITFLMGSKESYKSYMDKHPGTYFRSTGWIERNKAELDENGEPISVMTQLGLNKSYEEYVAEYGEENAKYIMEVMHGGLNHYDTLAYIDIKELGGFEEYEEEAAKEAEDKGWELKKLTGDIGLLKKLIDGPWGEDEFLVVPPSKRIKPSYDDGIIGVDR
jgi:hypothetical protein